MKYSLLPLVLITFFLSSCISKRCDFAVYEFDVPVTLSPAKATFTVGDTITVSSKFENQVFDRTTNKNYLLDNFNFYPVMYLSDLRKQIVTNSAVENFKILSEPKFEFTRRDFSDGAIAHDWNYNYENGTYSLEYKLVPQKAGLYLFTQGSLTSVLVDDQEFEGRCKEAGLDVLMNLNDGADSNIDFLKESPDSLYSVWRLIKPEERFHKRAGYCFYVVE